MAKSTIPQINIYDFVRDVFFELPLTEAKIRVEKIEENLVKIKESIKEAEDESQG